MRQKKRSSLHCIEEEKESKKKKINNNKKDLAIYLLKVQVRKKDYGWENRDRRKYEQESCSNYRW